MDEAEEQRLRRLLRAFMIGLVLAVPAYLGTKFAISQGWMGQIVINAE